MQYDALEAQAQRALELQEALPQMQVSTRHAYARARGRWLPACHVLHATARLQVLTLPMRVCVPRPGRR